MRSFLRFVVSILILVSFLIFLLITTIRFQLLNPEFLVRALGKPGVYEHTEKALKLTIKNTLRKQYEEESDIELEELTVGERARIDKEIEKITDIITSERLQDFAENNIVQILSFVNGKKEKLVLYLPFKQWGLPREIKSQEPFVLFSEETDVEKLIDTVLAEPQKTKGQLSTVQDIGEIIKIIWPISAGVIFVLLLIHYLLNTGPKKVKATASLLIKIGILTTGLSLLLKAVGDSLAKGSSYWRESAQIFVGAVLPPLISGVVKMWFLISLVLVFSGIAILVVNRVAEKRRMGKKQPKPRT